MWISEFEINEQEQNLEFGGSLIAKMIDTYGSCIKL
jgi:hypothetical protein